MGWFWQWLFSGERETFDVPDVPDMPDMPEDNMVDFDPRDFDPRDFG